MNRLENLPEIAGRQLGGLHADAQLLAHIRQVASGQSIKPRVRWKPILAGAMALTLCLCIGLWTIPSLLGTKQPAREASSTLLGTRAAGDEPFSGVDFDIRALDVPAGSISVGGSPTDANRYRNLFSLERNGNFPLVMVNGATYRMLISPTNMKDTLLGNSIGEVTEYTLEPALSTVASLAMSYLPGKRFTPLKTCKARWRLPMSRARYGCSNASALQVPPFWAVKPLRIR